MKKPEQSFHIHMISDATGETLITLSRAAAAQYPQFNAIEHIYPAVTTKEQLDFIFADIQDSPGIILYTLVDQHLMETLENRCAVLKYPCLSIMTPILQTYSNFLGTSHQTKIGAQHTLDSSYFQRIEAVQFAMMHDDGQLAHDLNEADIVIIGISRTSKTPTSIYLSNRGYKTANIPLISGLQPPQTLFTADHPTIIGLVANTERIQSIRKTRIENLGKLDNESSYINRAAIANEIAFTKKLCTDNGWPMLDVTKKSIEEIAAEIILHHNRRQTEHKFSKPDQSNV